MGAIQTRRTVPLRQPNSVRDFFVREAFRITQHHHDPLFLGQLGHNLLDTFLLLLTEQVVQSAFTGRPEPSSASSSPSSSMGKNRRRLR